VKSTFKGAKPKTSRQAAKNAKKNSVLHFATLREKYSFEILNTTYEGAC